MHGGALKKTDLKNLKNLHESNFARITFSTMRAVLQPIISFENRYPRWRFPVTPLLKFSDQLFNTHGVMYAEMYSEPCQTSKIERFAKIVNGF